MAEEKKDAPAIPEHIERVRQALLPGRGAAYAASGPEEAAQAILMGLVFCFSEPVFGRKLLDDLTKKTAAAEAIALVLDPASASRALTTRKNANALSVGDQLIRTAGKYLGTHGGKMPDARLALGAMIPDPEANAASAAVVGVHSASVTQSFRFSGADAVVTSHLRFLGMPVRLNGSSSRQVAEILSEATHPIAVCLLERVTEEAASILTRIGTAARLRLGGGVIPAEIGAHRKQSLFPIGEGRYISLSPLYSYGLAAELSARLRQRQSWSRGEARESFSTRAAHIGGTKPQNAGILPNFLGGEMPRLLAQPWTPQAGTRDDVLRRLRVGRIPLPAPILRKVSLEALQAAMSVPVDNASKRKAIEKALEKMVKDTLWAVVLLAELQVTADAEGRRLVETEEAVPDQNRAAARLVGIIDDRLTAGELSEIGNTIAQGICSKLRGKTYMVPGGKQTFAPGDDAHRYIHHVATTVLKDFN